MCANSHSPVAVVIWATHQKVFSLRAGPRSVQGFPSSRPAGKLMVLPAWDAKKRGSITGRPGPPGGPLGSPPVGSIFDVVTVMLGGLRTDNDTEIRTMTDVMITGFAGNTLTLQIH